MVHTGDIIIINSKIRAVVTTLFEVEKTRWFIGYQQSDGQMGFFLEGDEDFTIVDKGVDRERE